MLQVVGVIFNNPSGYAAHSGLKEMYKPRHKTALSLS